MMPVTFVSTPLITLWWNALFSDALLHPVPFCVILTPSNVAILGAPYNILDGLTSTYLWAPLIATHRVYSTLIPDLQIIPRVVSSPHEHVSVVYLPSHTSHSSYYGSHPSVPTDTYSPTLARSWVCILARKATTSPALIETWIRTSQIEVEWSILTV